MSTLQEIEQNALKLPETHRATLAAKLLDSLPPVLADEDEGVAEAMRRDHEMGGDPAASMSEGQFLAAVRAPRKR